MKKRKEGWFNKRNILLIVFLILLFGFLYLVFQMTGFVTYSYQGDSNLVFTNLENKNINSGESVNYDIDAQGSTPVSCFSVNDTINFNMDCNGILTNKVALNEGTYWVEISVNDSVNNVSISAISISVAAPFVNTKSNFTNLENKIIYTNTISYDINAEDIEGVSCFSVNDTTNFNIDCNGILTNKVALSGIYWITVSTLDNLNDTTTSSEFSISVETDSTVPVISLVAPTDSYVTTSNSVTFQYSVADNNAIANCSLILNNTINQTTNSSVAKGVTNSFPTTLAIGVYGWKVSCTDVANNIGNADTIYFATVRVATTTTTTTTTTTDTTSEDTSSEDTSEEIIEEEVAPVETPAPVVEATPEPVPTPQPQTTPVVNKTIKKTNPFFSSLTGKAIFGDISKYTGDKRYVIGGSVGLLLIIALVIYLKIRKKK
ncbi:MAG: hypothetical protein Q7S33_03280 [Nanoarchaeota archaeon]|nr:hypothetical protein [Nanoarchaeota archaeon]